VLRNINFNHVFYFWNIAKEKSIRSAATKLNLSPSTISDQLKSLERELGSDLFERRGRKLFLTDIGHKVFNFSNNYFKQAESLFESIKNKSLITQKIIEIGIVPTISKNLIYKIIQPLLKNPNYIIHVSESEYKFLINDLENNTLDLIITENKPNILNKSLVQYNMFSTIFWAVASPEFSINDDKFPMNLNNKPYINFTNHSNLHYQIHSFFHFHNIEPIKIGEIDDINLLKAATNENLCFSILPKESVEEDIKLKKLVKLGEIKDMKSNLNLILRDQNDREDLKDILNLISNK
jgi:LysR family transcriptional activator of nhaA